MAVVDAYTRQWAVEQYLDFVKSCNEALAWEKAGPWIPDTISVAVFADELAEFVANGTIPEPRVAVEDAS